MSTTPTYPIDAVCRLTGLRSSTLRRWEVLGLPHPAATDRPVAEQAFKTAKSRRKSGCPPIGMVDVGGLVDLSQPFSREPEGMETTPALKERTRTHDPARHIPVSTATEGEQSRPSPGSPPPAAAGLAREERRYRRLLETAKLFLPGLATASTVRALHGPPRVYQVGSPSAGLR